MTSDLCNDLRTVMTSVIIGFIIQYQFVTTLRVGRVMGRVNPSLLRSFRRTLLSFGPKVYITTRQHVVCQHSVSSRAGKTCE
jgi:hypothetical protein